MHKPDLVTIHSTDLDPNPPSAAEALVVVVQLNRRADIGTGAEGSGATHRMPAGSAIAKVLREIYPGAEVHTPESLNEDVISPIVVAKGTHVMRDGYPMAITKQDNVQLNQDALDAVAAAEDEPAEPTPMDEEIDDADAK